MIAIGDLVDSPYGRCKIRDRLVALDGQTTLWQCVPLNWALALGCRPTFYLNDSSIRSVPVSVGDVVKCNYGGLGRVESVRASDFVVSVDNWKLAQGQSPTLYLQREAFSLWTVLDEQEKTDSNGRRNGATKNLKRERLSYWKECIARATEAKNAAGEFFKKGSIDEAKAKYQDALQALQHLGGEEYIPDTLRAEIFETNTPCHNNIATCCLKTSQYSDAMGFARNGLLLARAMQSRIGSNMWRELVSRGMSEDKLMKDWCKKSLYLLAKAEMGLKEYDDACEHFEAALKLVDGDDGYKKNAAELRKALEEAQVARKKQLKKEQKIWGGAFEKSKQEEEQNELKAKKLKAKEASARSSSSSGFASGVNMSKPPPNASAKDIADSIVSKFLKPNSNQEGGDLEDDSKARAETNGASEGKGFDEDQVSTLVTVGIIGAVVVGVLYGARFFFRRR